jgi:hypothetical protein
MNTHKERMVSFDDLVRFAWSKRKPLLIIGIVSILLSSVFSGPTFIKPRYKSTEIFYPVTTHSISRTLLYEPGQRAQDALEFGAEEEAEKALQILQSSKLRSRLISKFDLINHYQINPERERYPMTKLEKKLDANIKVSRTRYLSIKIDVMDEDPQMAAKIARGMTDLYDTIKTEIMLERAQSALEIVERAHQNKENMIAGMHAQMQELGQKGVINYEEQSKVLQEALVELSKSGKSNQRVFDDLMKQQENLVQYGGLYISIVDKIKLEEEKLSDIKAKLDRARVDVEENMTHLFRLSDASPAEKKSYPVRWLIVAISFFSSLIATIVVMAILEKIQSKT